MRRLPATTPPMPDSLPRLNRFLARAGLGSRRSVEALVAAGRVTLDGEIVVDIGRRIDPVRDRVAVDGVPVVWPDDWSLLAYHKPVGVVSSLRRQDRRPCLADVAEAAGLPPSLVPVGRLDAATSGLLIWTDDGDLAQGLLRPRGNVWKRYEATLDAPLSSAAVDRLTGGGVELDGRPCLPARLRPRGADGRRWIMEIREGRNRQVRRMFAAVGLRVTALRRTAFGPVRLGNLPPGGFRELSATEASALRRAVAGRG